MHVECMAPYHSNLLRQPLYQHWAHLRHRSHITMVGLHSWSRTSCLLAVPSQPTTCSLLLRLPCCSCIPLTACDRAVIRAQQPVGILDSLGAGHRPPASHLLRGESPPKLPNQHDTFRSLHSSPILPSRHLDSLLQHRSSGHSLCCHCSSCGRHHDLCDQHKD